MADKSAIEWTEATWNPTTGCDRMSPGCDNCYALSLAKRLKAMGQPKYQRDGSERTSGPGFGLTLHPSVLPLPKTWSTPRTIFVNSMSDLFHPEVPFGYIQEVFSVVADTPQHTYQVLTKRSKRLVELADEPMGGRERRERPIHLPHQSSAPSSCCSSLPFMRTAAWSTRPPGS